MKPRTKTNAHAEIGDRLRLIREALEVSQRDAAEIAGVSVSTWNGWETGYARLSLDGARRLKSAWGVSLDFFFDGDRDALSARMIRALSLK